MIEVELNNEIKELKKIPAFLGDIFSRCTLEDTSRYRVRAGLDEALTNCVRYAYDTPGHIIRVSGDVSDDSLTFVIRDSGISFNPLDYKPEAQEPTELGGLGISIIRQSFDEVLYKRVDGFNVLTLVKHLFSVRG